MCISIVFGAVVNDETTKHFTERMEELGAVYGYGIRIGRDSLLPAAASGIVDVMGQPGVIFEVHDKPEPHCACDIDHDIRIASKLGRKSQFFDFVREILEFPGITSLSVLFFQDEQPGAANVRNQFGTYTEFVDLLNRWNTWQVERFEPVRQAFEIGDESPLLFTFTDQQHSQ